MTTGELLGAAHSFPLRPLCEMLEARPFIVVAPHPDDESLACGGLIADACRQAIRGKVVIVSDGAGSHPNSKAYPPDRLRSLREEEARQACAERGLRPEEILFLGLPDRFVPHEGEEAERAIGVIVDCARDIGARSLFVSWRHDPHCDHEASYRIARAVQRRVCGVRLFEYVVWDIRFRHRLRLIRFVAGSESASITRPRKRSAAPLPRTVRRQPISSTTIRPDFYSARSTWPISIFRTNSSSKAMHERTARRCPAQREKPLLPMSLPPRLCRSRRHRHG
jgi:LmbE family N-acetylglucosaminyl deacetylase